MGLAARGNVLVEPDLEQQWLFEQFRAARKAAGLPKNLVLYSARHDFGTRVLQKTGNLAAR